MRCGRASASTTRCTATGRRRSCCSRPGRSSTRGSGSCRCPTSPGTRRSSSTTARGNGRSDRPAGPSAYDDAELVADAVAVLDAVGVQEAVVVGLSLGARVLLGLAADHPERVRGAMFVGPLIELHDEPDPIRRSVRRGARELRGLVALERAPLAPRTRSGSRSSSSAKPSLRRTRPVRSRTPWRGRSRPTRRRSSRRCRPAAGSWAPPRRWPRPRRCAVRPSCCTATTTGSPRSPTGWPSRAALGSPLDVVAGGGHCVNARHPVWFNLRLRRFVEQVAG